MIATGVEEFARDLGRMAQLQPDRFGELATRLPPDRVHYIDTVLSAVSLKRTPDGITEEERTAWQPAKPESVETLLAFVEANWQPTYALSFVRVLRAYPDIEHTESTLGRLCSLASDPDPKPGEIGFSSTYDEDDKRARELATAAINCTRGCTAEALSSLVLHRPELIESLKPAIETLCKDPHPAVRVAALDIARSLTAHDAAAAIDMFLNIVRDAEDQVLITRASNTMIGWSYARAPNRIGQLIRRMIESEDPAVARAGALHAAAVNIVLDKASDLLDDCLGGSKEHRKGVARAASDLFGSEEYLTDAIPVLRKLFADDDVEVRREAKACFRGQGWLDVDEAAAFAEECGHMEALKEDPENVVLALHRCEGSLLRHSELIFAICKAYCGELAEQTRSIQSRGSAGPHWLGPVVFRLYEQAHQARDADILERCLDAIDGLLESRVGIGSDLASVFDA